MKVLKENKRAWITAAGAFLMMFASTGIGTTGVTLFYVPVASDLGFSQSQFALYFTISLITCTMMQPFLGKFYAKHSDKMKLSMIISAIMISASFIFYSYCTKLWQFYVISAMRGVFIAGVKDLPTFVIMSNWFRKSRNFIFSIVTSSASAGAVFATAVSGYFLTKFDWRISYKAMGISTAAFILIALLLIKVSPSGEQKPYGYLNEDEEKEYVKKGNTYKEAMRSPKFWAVCIALFLGGVASNGIQQCAAPYLNTEAGFGLEFTALIASLILIFITAGKFITGAIFEKFGVRFGVVFLGVTLIPAQILLLVSGSPIFIYIFAVLFGLGFALNNAEASSVLSYTFGEREIGRIYSVLYIFILSGLALGPSVLSLFYDLSNPRTYRYSWAFCIVISVIYKVILLLVIKNPKRKSIEMPAEQM